MLLKKSLSVVLIIFGLSVLLYSLYKSEIYFLGSNRKFYYPYFLISTIFFILALLNFYISQKLRVYFFIIFISSLFSFYSFELFLNFYPIKLKAKIYKQETGKNYDLRSKLEIYSDLKKNDNSIVVFSRINNKELQTFSGISKSETIYCNENGYYSSYMSDEYGFNNPLYDWNNDFFEYVLIGDSHIHGACVNRPFDISSVLRSVSNSNTLNLGIGGTGPLKQFAILKEYLPKKFKNLIWFYYPNDNEDLIQEIKDKNLKKYLLNDNYNQNLINKQKKIDNLLLEKLNKIYLKKQNENQFKNYINIIKLSKSRKLILNLIIGSKNLPQMPNEFFIILDKVQKIVEKNNGNFYMVLLPSYSQVKFKNDQANKQFDALKNKILKKNITVIDANKLIFEKEKNPFRFYPFEKSGHLNTTGSRAVAELVYKNIK